MDVSLIMFKTDGSRREFPLQKGSLVVGRTSDADLRIPLPSVSRKHCEFAFDGQAITLRDLGSSNGTLHNSTRIEQIALAAGDQVDVGPVSFYVIVDGQPAELVSGESASEAPATGDEGEMVVAEGDQAPTDQTIATGRTVVDEVPAATPDEAEADAEAEAARAPSTSESVAETPAATDKASESTTKPQSTPSQNEKPQDKPAEKQEDLDLEDALAQAAENPANEPASVPASNTPVAEDFEDPIAALQALADAEVASTNEFAAFLDEDEPAEKDSKGA